MNQTAKTCPVCGALLIPQGEAVPVEKLFALWAPIKFTPEVIAAHRRQAAETQLFTCGKCELGIFLPQIVGTGEFYGQLQGDAEHPYYSETKWDFTEAMRDCDGIGSLIELGCGPGEFLQLAKARGIQVAGTEYNEKALAIARGKGLAVAGPEGPGAGRLASFDAAFSFHVLEHVADPMAFLRDLLKWVRPGGKIGVSVPNQEGITQFIKPCVSDMPPHHASRWSLKTFEMAAKTLGLRIERHAVEPLALADAYYLDYWIKERMAGSIWNPLFQRAARRVVPVAVRRLKAAGLQTIPGFKGQAIYVSFSKR